MSAELTAEFVHPIAAIEAAVRFLNEAFTHRKDINKLARDEPLSAALTDDKYKISATSDYSTLEVTQGSAVL